MNGSAEDTVTVFIRRLGERNGLKDRHFKHDLEKLNKILPPPKDCDDFCSHREISIDDVSNYPLADVIASYMPAIREQLEIAPKKEFYYCKFTFAHGAGTVKYTPEHGDVSHYDFYKSDAFSVNLIHQQGKPIQIVTASVHSPTVHAIATPVATPVATSVATSVATPVAMAPSHAAPAALPIAPTFPTQAP